MPVFDLPLNPRIKVIFRGFIVTRVRDGEAEAMIGALRDSACHKPKVYVIEIAPNGAATILSDLRFDIAEDFRLQVEDTSTGIFEYHKDTGDFNRLDDENDPKDFRWFIDLDDLHKPKDITIDEEYLLPKFRLNKGIFHSSNLSDNEVRTRRHGATSSSHFGKYAQEISARVVLDRAGARAVLTNGDTEVLVIPRSDAERDFRYEIVFDCNCHEESAESDFGHVYDVIRGLTIPDDTFEMLVGTQVIEDPNGAITARFFRNPEVYCTGGNNHGGG